MMLIPFSDLHLGSSSCSENKINRLFERIINTEDCYAIGMGDYADLILKNDAKRFMGSCPKEDLLAHLDSLLNKQTDLVVDVMTKLAASGKLLGLCMGNHEYDMMKHHSYDIMREICRRLNVPYLGYSFFYQLFLSQRGNKRGAVTIYGHHGFGSSKRGGGALNKREDLVNSYDADIYLMGHDHHCGGTRLARLYATKCAKPKIVEKPIIVAATGSYHKTSMPGHISYSERRGYRPNPLGSVEITIDYVGHDHTLEMHIKE